MTTAFDKAFEAHLADNFHRSKRQGETDDKLHHDGYTTLKLLPPMIQASDPNLKRVITKTSCNGDGQASYASSSNVFNIAVPPNTQLSRMYFSWSQGAITGLTTGYRLKSVWDMFEWIDLKINNKPVNRFNDKFLSAFDETHSSYEEYSDFTGTHNTYGDAVASASTPVFSFDKALSAWGHGKLFPINLAPHPSMQITFSLKSLGNCTTSASGTAGGGAITEFYCFCEWIETTDYYVRQRAILQEKRQKHTFNGNDAHVNVKIPYFYTENCGKTDMSASTSEQTIALDNVNGPRCKELVVSMLSDGGVDSIVNKVEYINKFRVFHAGKRIYPSDSEDETDRQNLYKRCEYAKSYNAGNKNFLRIDFSDRPDVYNPALIDGCHKFDSSHGDGKIHLTQNTATASDVYVHAINQGWLEFNGTNMNVVQQ